MWECEEYLLIDVWLICQCGSKHRVLPGIGTPVYWCGNDLLSLHEGDDVEYYNEDEDCSFTT